MIYKYEYVQLHLLSILKSVFEYFKTREKPILFLLYEQKIFSIAQYFFHHGIIKI